jgi:hypothetical protein
MGIVRRFPVQEGFDFVDADGATLYSVHHATTPPNTGIADSLGPGTMWFERPATGDNLVWWKRQPGTGIDKWSLIAEDSVRQAEEIDFVITGVGAGEVTTIYIGRAVPGSLTSAAVWSISKTVVASGTDSDSTKTWADGDADADNVWDDRLILSYS